jgi:hypothetical protein
MNTQQNQPHHAIGKKCDHTFLVIGSEKIRSAKRITPHINPVTGRVYEADCPHPRCGRYA